MLRERNKIINSIPNNPGCYLFKDKTGAIIYVGKAQNLKKRVSSYFPSSPDNYFHQQIHSFNNIITNNRLKKFYIWKTNPIKNNINLLNIIFNPVSVKEPWYLISNKNEENKLIKNNN